MVEWKKLGEVCKVHTGSQLNKSEMLEDGPYPVVNGGKEYSGYTDKFNENACTITISQGGESAGFVNWIGVCFWAGAHCYVVEISEGYDTRYLFHTLKNKERDIQLSKQGAGIPGLNRDTLYKQVIPIPSLDEQTRIVGILDTFTASIENLKEQIAQRRKQYEYYRDQLLDLEGKEGVEIKTLGEIIQVKKGEYITRKDAIEGIYPVILGGKEPAYYIDKYNHTGKAIVISRSGASAGYVSFWNEPIFVTDGFLIEPRENVTIEFLYYLLKSKQMQLHSSQKGGAIPHVTPTLIGAIEIALPPLSEQQRIVSILDTFEASITNLEQQLAQREKQYEYYRNKLLTFE